MNYLVMEVHPAYAVVLDEAGRFLKTANLRYQVGDTVQEIVELCRPQKKRPALWMPLSGLAGLAACLCLAFFGYYQPNFTPYGALRIQINPDVQLTLSRTDRVLELEGLNEDGRVLIEGFAYQGRDRESVTAGLVERAIRLGYLAHGETVSITVSSADADWLTREEQAARDDLEKQYGESIVIRLGPAPEPPPADEIVIPVAPPTPTPTPAPTPQPSLAPTAPPAVSDDTDYDPAGGAASPDTDYGPGTDGVTDYAPSGESPYENGATDYGDRDDDPNDNDDDDGDDDGDDGDDDSDEGPDEDD